MGLIHTGGSIIFSKDSENRLCSLGARVEMFILYHSPGIPSGPGVFLQRKERIAASTSSNEMGLSRSTTSSGESVGRSRVLSTSRIAGLGLRSTTG